MHQELAVPETVQDTSKKKLLITTDCPALLALVQSQNTP